MIWGKKIDYAPWNREIYVMGIKIEPPSHLFEPPLLGNATYELKSEYIPVRAQTQFAGRRVYFSFRAR